MQHTSRSPLATMRPEDEQALAAERKHIATRKHIAEREHIAERKLPSLHDFFAPSGLLFALRPRV